MNAFLSILAGQLVARYASKLPPELLPEAAELVDALKALIEDGVLDFGGFTGEGEDGPAIVAFIENNHILDLVSEKVKEYQAKDDGMLRVDGMMGKRFLTRLLGGLCDDSLEDVDKSTLPEVEDDGVRRADIRWFWKGELPPIQGGGDAMKLFLRALKAWRKVADISSIKAISEPNANVVCSLGTVDGRRGGRLARAHIGPPGNRQLTLTMDIQEIWTPDRFQATACHELGHILGIRHRDVGPSDLMGRPFAPGMSPITPQAGDIAAIQRIWGEPA